MPQASEEIREKDISRVTPAKVQTDASAVSVTAKVFMLGGFRIQVGETIIANTSNRSRKLWCALAYLILHRDRTVSHTELIEIFWAEENRTSPGSALKTLFSRIRTALAPAFGKEINPIVPSQGGYRWNSAIPCELDIEQFEQLCIQVQEPRLSTKARAALYRQAVELYKNGFLPTMTSYVWVMTMSTRYHTMYMDLVKEYATLLEQEQDYETMQSLCTQATQMESLDEEIYVLLIRSLLGQGQELAALIQYENAVELLHRNLGTQPSEELRDLYRQILRTSLNVEAKLEDISNELCENAEHAPRIFVCEYAFFKEAYRLETRRSTRSGICTHIALITLSFPSGNPPSLEMLNETMNNLLSVLCQTLRRGDIVSRYSATQYVVLLYAANYENSLMVMNRIMGSYRLKYPHNPLRISYEVRELEVFD